MPRRRLRTFALWTGTLLCVLIAAAFVVSGWRWAPWRVTMPYGLTSEVNGGAFCALLDHQWGVLWHENQIKSLPDWAWWNDWDAGNRFVVAPLYAVFAAVAVPTLLVRRFGPKPVKPGHCRCGYNLTGLAEPRCPECGQPFEAKREAP